MAVSRQALAHYSCYAASEFELSPRDGVLQFASLNFDTSAEEIFPALLRGARIVLRNEDMLATPAKFYEHCAMWGVTVVDLPTAFWHQLVVDVTESARIPESVRLVILGGERMSADALQKWRQAETSRIRLLNTYGPTETTIVATVADLADRTDDPQHQSPPIGKPIRSVQTYVLDRQLEPLPMGLGGQLYIGGAGIARGYLGNVRRTAERFVPDPFAATRPGARIYASGDRCRWREDGQLEFLERVDWQIKIRGFRVELGEFESALLRQETIDHAAVVAYRRPGRDHHELVAYVVAREGVSLTAAQLRQSLCKELPEYMLPSTFVLLDELPILPNGKIDRQRLSDTELFRDQEIHGEYVPPRSPLESRLARVWEDVLGVAQVGVRDNFFELGGHSLSVLQLVAAVQNELGRPLRLDTLFESPTVEELAVKLTTPAIKETPPCVVPLRAFGSKSPLFIVHPSGGMVLDYLDLVEQLDLGRPVFGIQAVGLDGDRAPYRRVESMASHYCQEIRAVQPEGPYCLAGHSFGGLVVYEMAQQLVQTSTAQPFVVLIDTAIPQSELLARAFPLEELNEARWAVELLRSLGGLSGFKLAIDQDALSALSPGDCLMQIERELMTASSKLIKLNAEVGQRVDQLIRTLCGGGSQLTAMLEITRANVEGMMEYTPRPYPGPITLVRARDRVSHDIAGLVADAGDELWAWDKLVRGGVAQFVVPGDHFSMIRKPNAAILAETIQRALDI